MSSRPIDDNPYAAPPSASDMSAMVGEVSEINQDFEQYGRTSRALRELAAIFGVCGWIGFPLCVGATVQMGLAARPCVVTALWCLACIPLRIGLSQLLPWAKVGAQILIWSGFLIMIGCMVMCRLSPDLSQSGSAAICGFGLMAALIVMGSVARLAKPRGNLLFQRVLGFLLALVVVTIVISLTVMSRIPQLGNQRALALVANRLVPCLGLGATFLIALVVAKVTRFLGAPETRQACSSEFRQQLARLAATQILEKEGRPGSNIDDAGD